MNINKTVKEKTDLAGVAELKFFKETAGEMNHIKSYKLDICFKIIDCDIRKGSD